MWWCKPPSPFVNCIGIAHAAIAASTDWNKVVKSRLASLTFGDIVPTLVIKDRDFVFAPGHSAFVLKHVPHVRNPDLFGKCFGNLLFAIGFSWQIAKLHFLLTECMLYTGLPETEMPFPRSVPSGQEQDSYGWSPGNSANLRMQSSFSPATYRGIRARSVREMPRGQLPLSTARQQERESVSLLNGHEKTNRFLSRKENK